MTPRPDLVILDLMLRIFPERKSVGNFAKQETADIPVIMCTARDGEVTGGGFEIGATIMW